MSATPFIANPIGWVQARLIGGWMRLFSITGVYAGAILFFHILIYRMLRIDSVQLDSFAGGALAVMTTIQAIILLIGGCAAIKKAIHRDFTTDMITSHRVTAMSGYTAVIGYLTGPTAQVLILTLVNWLICTVLAILAGPLVPPIAPTAALLFLLCAAAMCWTFAILTALSTKGNVSVVGIVILLALASRSGVAWIVPGLAILTGAAGVAPSLIGGTAIGDLGPYVFIAMVAQLAFALTFFIAASRKYARDDVQAFDPVLAQALLALCAVIAGVGLAFSPASFWGSMSTIWQDKAAQTLASLTALALIAFVPVASAAKAAARWAKRKAKEPDYPGRKPRSFLLAPVAATLIIFSIMFAVVPVHLGNAWPGLDQRDVLHGFAWASVSCLLALVTLSGLLRFTYAITEKALWIVVGYVVLAWFVPALMDLAIAFGLDRPGEEPASMLFACSPVGAWIVAFKAVEAPLISGLVVQSALAAASLALASRAKH
ncbi:MAG: hypothetical protein ABII12_04145 [Planctomycetota bacterium]